MFFKNGSSTEKVSIDYPVGHRCLRSEVIPLIEQKFERYLRGRISQKNSDRILQICADQEHFERTAVDEMMGLMVV